MKNDKQSDHSSRERYLKHGRVTGGEVRTGGRYGRRGKSPEVQSVYMLYTGNLPVPGNTLGNAGLWIVKASVV